MVVKKIIVFLVLLLFIINLFSLIAIADNNLRIIESNSAISDENNNTKEQKPNRIAIIDTTYGEITIELFERLAPITTSNFINLSISGFYDGILFHRVIDDFVIQTGDPNTKDNNPYNDGSGGSDENIPLEINPELTHVDGAVGMARSTDPDSASSQFYICDGPQHGLDGDYAVFAVVIKGIEVVRKIAQVETWGNKRPLLKDHPIEDVVMYSVFITENTTEFHYTPIENDDDSWFADSSFQVPGFDCTMLIICIFAFMLIFKHKKKKY